MDEREYLVTYKTHVTACSPYLAARQVDEILHDPEAYPAFLSVQDTATGETTDIDLASEDDQNVIRKVDQNDA